MQKEALTEKRLSKNQLKNGSPPKVQDLLIAWFSLALSERLAYWYPSFLVLLCFDQDVIFAVIST